jgi:intracellular sulfur oxidation DsrE/DsrF family protein
MKKSLIPMKYKGNELEELRSTSSRRVFFRSFGLRIPVFSGMAAWLAGPAASANNVQDSRDRQEETWLERLKGTHRIVYDTLTVEEEFPSAIPYNFMKAHNQMGVQDNDLSVVVVLRHRAIPLAFEDRIWARYKLGKFFKVLDRNGVPAVRNPLWDLPDDATRPGVSLKALQGRGVIYCVCEMAISKSSNMIASAMNLDPAEVRKDWISGLLPDFVAVPAGVWAVQRAQQQGCAYCFGG